MDELQAALKARELARRVNLATIPASVEVYAADVGAVIRRQTDLGPAEAGWAFHSSGKHYICVNANDSAERQRFTVCHEIAHIVLGLPSSHGQPSWSGSYIRKAPEEILCDVFAAELLLPYHLFKPRAEKVEIGFASIEQLADEFVASLMATGSRFATVLSAPCAFVLSEQGQVRYTSRSLALREANAWVTPQSCVPQSSVSARIRSGGASDTSGEIEADKWFENWTRGGALCEEARYLRQWDQTLTLLWFEDEEVPSSRERPGRPTEDDELLPELDGVLSWPGKRRRK